MVSDSGSLATRQSGDDPPREAIRDAARALQLEAELAEVGSALSQSGIEWISMKGPVLARRLGLHAHVRGWVLDNDVLVHKRDVRRAVEVLTGLGYEPSPFVKLESQLRVTFETAMWRFQSGVPLCVEVHWSPFPWPLYPANEPLVWRRTETYQLSGRPVRVFDPTLTIVHLASHYVQHQASEPRILRDLAWAWKSWHEHLDPRRLQALSQALRLAHVVAFSLHVASERELLRTPPFDTRRARALRRLLSAGNETQNDYLRLALTLLVAPPERVPRWLWHNLAPPIDVLASIYRRPVSPALYLRYLSRPFRPAARWFGLGRTAARRANAANPLAPS